MSSSRAGDLGGFGPWPASLFGRIVVVQIVLVVAIGVLLGALFLVERNRAAARLFAERWSPVLRQLVEGEPAVLPQGVVRSSGRPSELRTFRFRVPRLAALEEAFVDRGLPVTQIVAPRATIRGADEAPAVWIELRGGSAADPTWVSIPVSAHAASLPWRLLGGLCGAAALTAILSLLLTRHLTRPLASLQADIESYDPLQVDGRRVVRTAPDAPRELASIARAWNGLIERTARQERQRSMALAALSHDLRSPLARIRLAAELLRDDPDSRRRRDSIVRNVQVADRFIEAFLSYLRAGELPVGERCDLARIAVDVASRCPEGAVDVAAGRPVWIAQASALLVDCAIQNLVDNALKHGAPPVLIEVRVHRDRAVVEVLDHGPGIDVVLRPSATDPFVRGDASRSRPGSGLGLAIVDRAVGRMGGSLAFVDAPERGLHGVRLEFPHVPPAATGHPAEIPT